MSDTTVNYHSAVIVDSLEQAEDISAAINSTLPFMRHDIGVSIHGAKLGVVKEIYGTRHQDTHYKVAVYLPKRHSVKLVCMLHGMIMSCLKANRNGLVTGKRLVRQEYMA